MTFSWYTFLITWENIMVFLKTGFCVYTESCFTWSQLIYFFLLFLFLKTILFFYVSVYFPQTYIITRVHGAHRDQDGCYIQ